MGQQNARYANACCFLACMPICPRDVLRCGACATSVLASSLTRVWPCAQELPAGDRKTKEIGCLGDTAKLMEKCTDHSNTNDVYPVSAEPSTSAAAGQTQYPLTYTVCGVDHTITQAPSRMVTFNQGVTEFMLAMGLADKMVGHAYLDDAIWPRYKSEYDAIAELASGYPTESQIAAMGICDANGQKCALPLQSRQA